MILTTVYQTNATISIRENVAAFREGLIVHIQNRIRINQRANGDAEIEELNRLITFLSSFEVR